MNQHEKVYLGDSVYAQFDGYMIQLTTENGMGVSNRIFLDSQTYDSLQRYVESLKEVKDVPPNS